jgi:hypothetical protein
VAGQTRIGIRGADFWLNDAPTYAGRTWLGNRIEGLLLNARMVQATFDDLNPDTRGRWVYPDTGRWDPERNVSEFLAMLPVYRRRGLLAVTVNCQGGSPEGYSREQPWENSAFAADGALRPAYADRLARVIAAADACGMVVIVGYFYQGQDERLQDEAAVLRAVDATTEFLLAGRWAIWRCTPPTVTRRGSTWPARAPPPWRRRSAKLTVATLTAPTAASIASRRAARQDRCRVWSITRATPRPRRGSNTCKRRSRPSPPRQNTSACAARVGRDYAASSPCGSSKNFLAAPLSNSR